MEGTMKKVKILVLVVFLFCLLTQNDVFAAIESRIQGKIIDSETNNSVLNAVVLLYKNDKFFSLENTANTNANGEFIFNNLTQGVYCVGVIKNGYAAQGPFCNVEGEMEPGIYKVNETKKAKFVNLGEGKIKHLIIKIEKEAVLEIAVLKKDEKGLLPAKGWINFKVFPEDYFDHVNHMEVSSHIFLSKYLGAGKVKAVISTEGVQSKVYDNIVLEKGKKTAIEYIIDYTTGSLIYGIIKDVGTGMPIINARIAIYKEDDSHFNLDTTTDENGKYKMSLLCCGTYNLFISSAGADTNKEFYFKTKIVINNINDRVQFNKSF